MMNDLPSYRKLCLSQQSELRRLLEAPAQFEAGMQLFFKQHAMLHSAKVSEATGWSYEDEILDDMSQAQVRRIPPGCEHSVAWLIWHSARCEDITLNRLVAGGPQVLLEQGWLERMQVPVRDTGNAMSPAEIAQFSAEIDIPALRGYRAAVGLRTRQIVRTLQPSDLKQPVCAVRLQQALDEEAVLPAAHEISDYWGSRDIVGLLLMPATRHNLVHLNEALKIKQKRA